MKKLYELLGLKKTAGDVGLEIECEGENLKHIIEGGWRTEDDNSLRGRYPDQRCEWIFVKPLPIRDVLPAVEYLVDSQKNSKINFSFRTSTHVHVNVQQLEFDHVMNMIYSYLLCETVLMNFCGKSRIGNRFCLRLEDAEALEKYVRHILQQGENGFYRMKPNDQIRYAAINLEAMWKYGSLEFRGMEGTIDPVRIHTWCSALVNLRTFAKKFNNIQEIHDLFVQLTPEQFFNRAVGNVADEFKYEGFVNDLRKGFSLTIDLPYAYVNSQQIQDNAEKEILKRDMKAGLQFADERVEAVRDVLAGRGEHGLIIDGVIAHNRIRIPNPQPIGFNNPPPIAWNADQVREALANGRKKRVIRNDQV